MPKADPGDRLCYALRFWGLLHKVGKRKDEKAILQNEMMTREPFIFNFKKNEVHFGSYSNKRRLPAIKA